MNKSSAKLKKLIKEIFDLSFMLQEFCKNNIDTQKTESLYTLIKILHQKIDGLNFEFLKTNDE